MDITTMLKSSAIFLIARLPPTVYEQTQQNRHIETNIMNTATYTTIRHFEQNHCKYAKLLCSEQLSTLDNSQE